MLYPDDLDSSKFLYIKSQTAFVSVTAVDLSSGTDH
jgi:hypothetical protein